MATVNNKILYTHVRDDKNEIFYIGIGNPSRPYCKHGRNDIWNKITNKTSYKIKIIYTNLTNKEAKELEKELIRYYGKLCEGTGCLANISDGGDNINSSKYTANKISKSLTGRQLTINHKKNISLSHTGKVLSKNTRNKISSKLKINNPNSKKVINVITGKIYNSIKEASIDSSLSYSAFRAQLNNQNTNNTNFRKYAS